jgi:hypothetical protein
MPFYEYFIMLGSYSSRGKTASEPTLDRGRQLEFSKSKGNGPEPFLDHTTAFFRSINQIHAHSSHFGGTLPIFDMRVTIFVLLFCVFSAFAAFAEGQCQNTQIIKTITVANKQFTDLQRLTGTYYSLAQVQSVCVANLVRPVQNFWSDVGNRTSLIQDRVLGVMACMKCDGAYVGQCDQTVFQTIDAYMSEISTLVMGITTQVSGRCNGVMADAFSSFPNQIAKAVSTAQSLASC